MAERVGDMVMQMDICFVLGFAEITLKESVEKTDLNVWWQEIRIYEQTYLPQTKSRRGPIENAYQVWRSLRIPPRAQKKMV